jgi:1,4-dihydroxy-2-naphthoate octaprenyltransferase
VLWLGIAAFAGALAVGVYLTVRVGWPILAFAVLGGLAAIFYVAPPIRWAYRGLGETVIALSYGPWMVLGSLYLHTRSVSWEAFWASLVPGFMIMALAVVNAIPDYHQDRLVGKRNLVVRLGRRRGVWLYLALAAAGLATVVAGVAAGVFPVGCLAALLALPLLVSSARAALPTYESPRQFVPAIRAVVACYAVAVSLFGAGLLVRF